MKLATKLTQNLAMKLGELEASAETSVSLFCHRKKRSKTCLETLIKPGSCQSCTV